MHNQPREPQPCEDCQEKSIQEFGWASQGMNWGWGQGIKTHTDVSRSLAWLSILTINYLYFLSLLFKRNNWEMKKVGDTVGIKSYYYLAAIINRLSVY